MYLLEAAAPRPKTRECDYPKRVVLSISIIVKNYHVTKIECTRATSNDKARANIGLSPQILRTCRAIHLEAASILYTKNILQFCLYDMYQVDRWWSRGSAGQERLETFCRGLYHHTDKISNGKDPRVAIKSTFAIFLRRIGRQNAASLSRLRFVTTHKRSTLSDKEASWTIDMVTYLLKYHASNVHHLEIYREPRFIFREMSAEEEEKTLSRAIANMVQKIPWLKQLRIAGFKEDGPKRQKIEDLQALVNNRR